VFWYVSVPEIKAFLSIAQDDHAQDALLHGLLVCAQTELEQWTGQIFWHRRICEEILCSPYVGSFPTVLELMLAGVTSLLERLRSESEDDHAVVSQWTNTAVQRLEEDQAIHAVVLTQQAAVLTCEPLSCRPRLHWVIERHLPHYVPPRGHVLPTKTGMVSLRHERRLVFRQGDRPDDLVLFEEPKQESDVSKNSPPRLDVAVYRDGETNRAHAPRKGHRKLKSLLHPYTPTRLYIPKGPLSKQALQWRARHIIPLLCLYLVQKESGMLLLDEHPDIYGYLTRFLRGVQGADEAILDKTVVTLLNAYHIPEDSRAFHKYVKKTMTGHIVNTRKEEQPQVIDTYVDTKDSCTVHEASAYLDISKSTLYDYIRTEKIQTQNQPAGLLMLSAQEIERLKTAWERKQQRRDMITLWSERRGCSLESAERWMQRQEKAGLDAKAICQKVCQERQEHADDKAC
jgi:hypothetical protein